MCVCVCVCVQYSVCAVCTVCVLLQYVVQYLHNIPLKRVCLKADLKTSGMMLPPNFKSDSGGVCQVCVCVRCVCVSGVCVSGVCVCV